MLQTLVASVAALVVAGVALGAVPRGSTERVEVYPPEIEGARSMAIELVVDGKAAGPLRQRVGEDERPLVLEIEEGFHRYQLAGVAEMADGGQVALEGSGILFSREAFLTELEQRGAPQAMIWAVFEEWRKLAGSQALPRLEEADGVEAEAFAGAEARLGTKLPAAYRNLLRLYGALRIEATGDEGPEVIASWFAPAALQTVPDWRRDQRQAPLGEPDTPRARARLEQFSRDVVLGTTFDTVWTLRLGTHPLCPDGSPSLSGEYLFEVDPAEELWLDGTDAHQSYFGDAGPRCDVDFGRLNHDLAAVVAEAFARSTACPHNGALRLIARAEIVAGRPLRLSLGD